MAAALRDRLADGASRPFLSFEDARWSFAEAYRESCRFANLLLKLRDHQRPFHVGVLMDNLPDFVFAELGCALAGATLVGLNPTRTGGVLLRDIAYADCQIILVERRYAGELRAAPGAEPRVLLTDWVGGWRGSKPGPWPSLEEELSGVPADDPQVPVDPGDLLMIIFTSGTTTAPKGVLNSHRRLMLLGWGAAVHMCQFTSTDTVYAAMPLFHTNAQVLAFVPALLAGGVMALARRFSKTRFLADVRRYGATLFNYVGTPLAYIMETPERPDDGENPLRLAYGNEAPRRYIEAFARRFRCRVVDGYGASEVGVGFAREPGDPPASLGRAAGVKILDERGEECPPARFDAAGRLLNADEAVGEIVNTAGHFLFEGYYKDEGATRERTRHDRFYTGDLGYRDERGFIYFAGRDAEWIRVGGENFPAHPIEEILGRYPGVMVASVYGVADPEAGDQVMVCLLLRPGAKFDPEGFGSFLDTAADLPARWRPTFVRVARHICLTPSNKVLKRALRREKFLLGRVRDPIFWRPPGSDRFRRFTDEDLAGLRARFERAGHAARLEE